MWFSQNLYFQLVSSSSLVTGEQYNLTFRLKGDKKEASLFEVKTRSNDELVPHTTYTKTCTQLPLSPKKTTEQQACGSCSAPASCGT